MRNPIRLLISVLTAGLLCGSLPVSAEETQIQHPPAAAECRVVGYLPDWSYTFYQQLDYSALTHLDIAFCNPDTSCNFSCDIPDSILHTIVETAHANNVRVMPSIALVDGGGNFATLIQTEEKRTKLNTKLFEYCQEFGFDGIDLDIEKGSTDSFWKYYGSWVSELRTECDKYGMELSTATAEWTAKGVTAETFALFDFITVMCYEDDYSTVSHTSMSCINREVGYLVQNKSIPLKKLVVGIPFYGRAYTADGKIDRTFSRSFGQLIAADPENFNRNLYEGITYNGAPLVREKVAYSKEYGGVMIWQVAQDAARPYSLLGVIKREMHPVACDSNGDSVFDADDAQQLKRWLLTGTDSLLPYPADADFNADGLLSAKDLTLLKRKLLQPT